MLAPKENLADRRPVGAGKTSTRTPVNGVQRTRRFNTFSRSATTVAEDHGGRTRRVLNSRTPSRWRISPGGPCFRGSAETEVGGQRTPGASPARPNQDAATRFVTLLIAGRLGNGDPGGEILAVERNADDGGSAPRSSEALRECRSMVPVDCGIMPGVTGVDERSYRSL